MKIPKSIKVGGLKYKIELVNDLDDGDTWGKILHEKLIIRICRKMDEQAIEKTFWHELTHAIDFEADTKMTEHQVEVFSAILFQVLKDNKLYA